MVYNKKVQRNITNIIQKEIETYGKITSNKLSRLAGISRQAAHKRLSKLANQSKLIKVGKTRHSYYIPFSAENERRAKEQKKHIKKRVRNRNLQEDLVFDGLEKERSILNSISSNAKKLFRYAFTEMLNNAIEHSGSEHIAIEIFERGRFISFEISDTGIGIFNKIRKKYRLKNDLEALQELLKGKKTTDPKNHTGEGVFFTSKIADKFEIFSGKLNLLNNNLIDDIIVKESPSKKGTRVVFTISKNSRKDLAALFNEYTNEKYKFYKTKAKVKLYERGEDYVSRSQARRILFDLDKFDSIVLDFRKIKGIGQGFADEIFRVYKNEHPNVQIATVNACPAVKFMIKRAEKAGLQ